MWKRILKSSFCANKQFGKWNSTSSQDVVRPLILGIETSCDDTGAALIDRTGKVFGECLHSQQDTHLRYGGIIPPVAQDLHRQNIERVVTETFANARLTIKDVDAIAVTNRPGLPLSLIIGLRYAKHLARTHSKPIIPIHHMEAHALTARINYQISFPFVCLLASGGHCILSFVQSVDKFYRLGETMDDAPGEAFDKIARHLKLRNIPEFEWKNGGQAIEIAASRSKNPGHFEFPLPLARYKNCDFSFAGLKNTAKRFIMKSEKGAGIASDEVIPDYEDFCAGFLRGVTRHICHRTQRALEYCDQAGLMPETGRKVLVFSGGVACNDFLYEALSQLGKQFGYEIIRPPRHHCTDNGLMIAWNGVERWMANGGEQYADISLDDIDVQSKCPLGEDKTKDVAEAAVNCKWAKIPIMKV